MGVEHSPKTTNVNLARGGRTNRLAPHPPANNVEYVPEELASMTHEQRLWLAEHPRFWIPRGGLVEDSDDDFRDPLESPGGISSSTGVADDADTTMTHSDTTAKLKGRSTPNTLGLAGLGGLSVADPVLHPHSFRPMITDDGDTSKLNLLHSEATRQAALEGVTSYGRYETNVGRVFKDWSFSNCPRYNGSVEIDVKRWLGTLAAVLDSQQAHPDIWHLVGFRLLEHKAFLDYEDAINSGARPGNWIGYCNWLLDLNPLCVSKDSILDDYDKLYQQPNETAQSFFQRFREWQHKAKNYGFHYEASSGFVTRLNRGLKDKVKGIVAVERRRGTPLTFDQIVVTALEEDQTYRTRTANSIASGSRQNKRPADTPAASNSKRPGGSGSKDNNTRACYNCGKNGHLSSNCPEPKTAKQLKYEAKKVSGAGGSAPAESLKA
ncbi:hypothetical protein PCANC_16131 [Puccinia coronata f. sp. avenae]|uniref:CCHC-type domain-containing protein n=1 Tax=Puccinia coronata f. sp. avenae TaxID=200324 RepID=A0A2N5SRU1_9BASI|nr:hypothetical protein PCANC_16131 [Puccinia coronata f. sp. avenae]